jgi:hypothetical protein
MPEAGQPPRVILLRQHLPPVQRISPELSCGTEIVGRNSGHMGGTFPAIQLEVVRIPPDIHTLIGHIDGEIPDQMNTSIMGVIPKLCPLLKKKELQELRF